MESPTTTKLPVLTCITGPPWGVNADDFVARPDTFVVDYPVDLMGSAGEAGEGSLTNDSNLGSK